MTPIDDRLEWLEADGRGGFACGTASGVRTRRYHALLVTATTPPTGRMVIVNGFDAWITTPVGRFAISSQRYSPDVIYPDGCTRIASFTTEPWPIWEFDIPDGVRIAQEVFVQRDGATILTWRLVGGTGPISLEMRPFFSGRDYHTLHHENTGFNFEPEEQGAALIWTPYPGVPAVKVATNAKYTHAPDWYRNFLYSIERERGLDDREDLASPGVFSWTLHSADDEATAILAASGSGDPAISDPLENARRIRTTEKTRRSAFANVLDRAADAYLVRRGQGRSILAGYPWFTDWGRDTFIAVRGLCIATGRLSEARDILLEWSSAVSHGMLPNRFPDSGEAAEFNAVDASLWFIVAVHDLLERAGDDPSIVSPTQRARMHSAILSVVEGYAGGTRYGIRADADGLLRAGEPGVQLTWMDARVGDRVVTPRTGKPVEIEALWLNALWIACAIDSRWQDMFETGRRSFTERFWNDDRACLFDVVDVDHVPRACDPTIRPNQIFAAGGLPFAVLSGDRARSVVDVVERDLVTPFGLRSLARFERDYTARYEGGPSERDGIYHQGAVWPWLLGAFVDAWVIVHGDDDVARTLARRRFVEPLLAHVMEDGSGHLCEITDAEPPFAPRGCPFQAWSLGELIRADRATAARRHEVRSRSSST